jgi:hypothetical protein
MRRDRDEMMHPCHPRPTVRTRSFNNGVQKGRWEWNHPSFTKVCSSTLLPPRGHLKYLFQKKEKKMGGISTICLRPFVRGNSKKKLIIAVRRESPSGGMKSILAMRQRKIYCRREAWLQGQRKYCHGWGAAVRPKEYRAKAVQLIRARTQ